MLDGVFMDFAASSVLSVCLEATTVMRCEGAVVFVVEVVDDFRSAGGLLFRSSMDNGERRSKTLLLGLCGLCDT
jgi:hypothetical protein